MMKFIRTSNDGRLFSFDVHESAPQFDASSFKQSFKIKNLEFRHLNIDGRHLKSNFDI